MMKRRDQLPCKKNQKCWGGRWAKITKLWKWRKSQMQNLPTKSFNTRTTDHSLNIAGGSNKQAKPLMVQSPGMELRCSYQDLIPVSPNSQLQGLNKESHCSERGIGSAKSRILGVIMYLICAGQWKLGRAKPTHFKMAWNSVKHAD